MSPLSNLTGGIIKENPTFVLMLGMCPTLATTTSALNGMGMGAATLFVLALSNLAISMVGSLIPSKVRIPCYIVIIATFVTMVDLLMQAFVPALYATLGIFIPLIVVNCIVLGRAEAFAARNGMLASLLDGVGMGLGFTLSLTVIGAIRELLGSWTIFGQKLVGADGMLVFILAPGAFIVLGYLMMLFNRINKKGK
jgi:electron transport complex, RnfABCDGE type, E subunit